MKMTWGMRVKLRLDALHKTQRDLADCCNYSPSQISRVLSGRRNLRLERDIDHVLRQWEAQEARKKELKKHGIPC